MSIFIIFLFMLFSQNVFSSQFNQNIKCEKQFNQWQNKTFQQKKMNWTRFIDPSPNLLAYRASNKVGTWYQAEIKKNETGKSPIKIFEIQSTNQSVAEFDVNCQMHWTKIVNPDYVKLFKNEGFTDSNLNSILRNSFDKPALIYVWSPAMIYSMNQAVVIEKIAKELHLQWTPIVDRLFSIKEKPLRKLASGTILQDSLAQNSFHLWMLQVEDHFPTLLLVKNGQIFPQRLHGVMPEKLWKQTVQKWLSEI